MMKNIYWMRGLMVYKLYDMDLSYVNNRWVGGGRLVFVHEAKRYFYFVEAANLKTYKTKSKSKVILPKPLETNKKTHIFYKKHYEERAKRMELPKKIVRNILKSLKEAA